MQGQVDSLIPLLYLRHGNLEAAMDAAIVSLKTSIAAFEFSSRRLLDRYSDDTDTFVSLDKFIHGCRCACTANLNWRSVIPRCNCTMFVADSPMQHAFRTIQTWGTVFAGRF